MDSAPLPLALYFHWPFCRSKCAYCAFNSVTVPLFTDKEEEVWVRALIASLEWHVHHILGNHVSSYVLQSIFFGGGTPSLLAPSSVSHLIEYVRTIWRVDFSSTEITLEANPDTITPDRLAAFSQAGINRLSLGIQALSSTDLARLGRTHSLECAQQAISWARDQFINYNLDFIYKRHGQSLQMWKKELAKIFTLNSPHLSLYELTIEPGTLIKRHAERSKASRTGNFLELTLHLAEENGYTAYEISNFCKQQFACKHNLAYWRYQDYLGIGPGAHSRISQKSKHMALTAFSNLAEWQNSANKNKGGLATKHYLSSRERLIEHLLMGLRVKEGVLWQQLENSAGTKLVRALQTSSHLRILREQNILIETQSGIAVSPKGRLLIDGIVSYLNI
ncbi:MAG: radical SAM family heme chaperone HemW [Holosporales bacterium]|jgi:oxygen-independent coproporphyrinogen-3 oxidase|nr:radical SAM family heme chaperone HemW [Holosporales bacterium]